MDRNYMEVRHGGETLSVWVDEANESGYQAGLRWGKKSEEGDVVLLQDEDVKIHRQVSEPRSIGVSETGRLVYADWIKYGESTGAEVVVFDSNGTTLYDQSISGSAPLVDISQDGDYIVVCPYGGTATIESVETGETIAIHDYDIADRLVPQFTSNCGEPVVEFSFQSDTDPLYQIDISGDIYWKSDGFEEQQYYEVVSLDESVDWRPMIEKCASDYQEGKEELKNRIANRIGEARLVDASASQLEEIVAVLEDYQNVFTVESAHSKLISQTLGDANYRLAKEEAKTGRNTEFWDRIEAAGEEYQNVLPWYEGKKGLTKILRYQGKQYRKLQRPREAYDCYKQIKSLEQQFEVNLLSDADERYLEEYSSQGIDSKSPQETGRLATNLYMYA